MIVLFRAKFNKKQEKNTFGQNLTKIYRIFETGHFGGDFFC